MSDDLTLWQQVLGAEHAAIYGYGLVGATNDLAEAAASALVVHRQRRSVCLDAVVALGGTPEESAPAYDIDRPADTEQARGTAAALEAACWPAYVALAGSDDRRTRLTGAGWLRESTVRAQAWDGSVAPLPGLDT
jgi:hypothetical protein